VPSKLPKRYGLTCGFWTDDNSKITKHLLQFHFGTDDPDIYDLAADQWQGEPLHKCGAMT
jgi:hypothetical protein